MGLLRTLMALLSSTPKANFYIDGFNLYYRAVKGTPYKWLDLSKVCKSFAPTLTVNRIRYFTARIHARAGDLQGPQRQQTYLRALATIPNLTVVYGQFRGRNKKRPLLNPIQGLPPYVWIKDTEEKGTDVNLASYLLSDGYTKDYDHAFVISNDSDLALPIRMVRDILGRNITVVNPNIDPNMRAPKELVDAATSLRPLRENTLLNCQFPSTLTDSQGTITKPSVW